MKFVSFLLGCLLLLSGCGEHMQFPVSSSAQEKLPENLKVIRVTPENINETVAQYYAPRQDYGGSPPPNPGRYTYRIGTGDQLRIQVWTTPERTSNGAEQSIQPDEGPVVDETGAFFYPFVGEVDARNRTVREIRSELTERLQDYLKDPQVEVAVDNFRAHHVMVTGDVGSRGPTTLTNVPLHLVDLLNASGTSNAADLSRVKLRRGGVEYLVNAQLFLQEGDPRHNPVLLPGDAVHVPKLVNNDVYIFGEIATSAMPLGTEEKSLTELLAEVGGISRQRANARGVFVFRSTDEVHDEIDAVFQFDLTDASALIMMKSFPIMAQDIVFVTKDPVTRWTDTVGRVLAPATGFLQVRGVANQIAEES
ncbi:polysaccharide biosynthesis/export family protein [Salibaculum sp.]|uniref:polysaccharide biosynthesis/export family protein n=1 Tax=Salibaculum sp. TaxID=2855480 RepID=UPI002B481C74|nr:polysaccharide biosynthesis/export family protein [Salibaculum sp.]HKL69622.1 polysaccharide biosynthesis/export family protein [Salibaculum sp.]